jgi:hypothetical protein
MLGNQFYAHKGKIIGQRVLDVNGEEGPKITLKEQQVLMNSELIPLL